MNRFAMDREKIRNGACIAIKEARTDSDMNQEELGKKIGMTRAQVANLETGRRQIHIAEFVAIAAALGVNPVSLMARVCKMQVSGNDCPMCRPAETKKDSNESKWLTPIMEYNSLQHCDACGSYFRCISITAPVKVVFPSNLRDGRSCRSEGTP